MAIIGCGAATRICHLPALKRVPSIEISCIYDLEKKIAEETASRAHFNTRIADSIDEIFKNPSISAVLIATPPSTHANLMMKCAETGKSVFVEKPFVTSQEEAQQCYSIIQKSGIKFQIGFNLRFSQDIMVITDFINRKVIGSINHLEYDWHSNIKAWPSMSGFQYSKVQGGVLFDMGCHLLDLAYFWLGMPSVAKGYGRLDSTGTYVEEAQFDLYFPNNVSASFSISWVAKKPKKKVVLTTNSIKAELEKEGWILRSRSKTIFRSGLMAISCISPRTSYENELCSFADCVTNNRNCSPGLQDAMANMRILDLTQSNFTINNVTVHRK